ncbi:16S rRNA (guanine(527)-N(7))-methyltransferase RsmG [Rubellicoccus peritrichatus]|uniref:Ribosomal RNA small subunit methyltransferase G n=1 Tax=Rubellicoccus peritrichatus TaxID=3080537 RepID=A0AAQ3QX26_9BACT|nr:16S rRNA (guanine(527)-N(7))-methyltransferase RsmG [Puniceicoccus sp. CR14]WOO43248.1 16S rRNA (guanine(527)-N(7))-methyltransferase RsmG [Puniceicoccus sp. CR14]
MNSELTKWFPDLPGKTSEKLTGYAALMREWNEKINLVSRKDIEAFEVNHLAPCVAITHKLNLMDGARVLDVGTGGGLPGLVMAICYPQARFLLVDSVGKKIRVVDDIAKRLELKNVEARHCRVETINKEFDFITGRAVTALPRFISWIKKKGRKGKKHSLENGLLYWKGGPLDDDLKSLGITPRHVWQLEELLSGGTYPEKYIVHFAAQDLARAKVLIS